MMTASLDIENILPKFNRYTQALLDRTLKHDVFQPCLKLSKNSEKFVWQCLQVSPKARISGLEAACHDWLCTPEKHLAFFQQLDHKILGSWKAPAKLNPMPLQLPSVLMGVLAQERDQEELLKAYATLSQRYHLLQTEFSRYFGTADLKNKSSKMQITAASSDIPESSGTEPTSPSREVVDSHQPGTCSTNPKRKHDEVLSRDMKPQIVPRRDGALMRIYNRTTTG
ncbi:uncharacterized protein MAM_01525 [Metarhizium album ARSEF 1941]|uniref:Uncharacterized protein n=1 Tax=Metarhizium album (strain ARSEF 1941) TaxID=1081103 RepID=A0A0B2WX22_METAS|nr:uncharacterized protein MAM_01525 [Metarhizium album ARSEF 1941]KHO00747.1 hypothetical protein MAM_01525 [Metarhizium album ARSEF 1941]